MNLFFGLHRIRFQTTTSGRSKCSVADSAHSVSSVNLGSTKPGIKSFIDIQILHCFRFAPQHNCCVLRGSRRPGRADGHGASIDRTSMIASNECQSLAFSISLACVRLIFITDRESLRQTIFFGIFSCIHLSGAV